MNHTNGSQSQYRFGAPPEPNTNVTNKQNWMPRCTQLPSTAESGITSLGTVTRLMRVALSAREVVPEAHATVKKLKGTRPQRMNVGKWGMVLLANTFVNTKVITPIMMS